MRFDLSLTAAALGGLRSSAQAKVDGAAGTARSAWITGGAGMDQEYQQTAIEAAAALVAPDPLSAADYPFLGADQAAHATGGITLTLRQVAQQVAAQHAAWLSAAAAIKQARLTAKRKIAAATTQQQIDTILAGVEWPAPPQK